MIKNINTTIGFALALLFFTIGTATAQNKLEIEARNHMAAKEYDLAKPLLDSVSNDTTYTNSCEYWYLKGFLYKELSLDTKNDKLEYLDLALDHFEKSMELDKDGSHKDGNIKGIKSVAIRSNNEVVGSIEKEKGNVATNYFEVYLKSMVLFGTPESELINKEVIFKLALGSMYDEVYESSKHEDGDAWESKINAYNEVLSLDSNNISSYYGLGSSFYNKAVYLIMEMDYTTGMQDLANIQDECLVLFKQALPYLIKAHQLNAEDQATIEGLAGTYFSMSEMEKSNYYLGLAEIIENNKTVESRQLIEDYRQKHDWYNWDGQKK